MTLKQRILKLVYPLLMLAVKSKGKQKSKMNTKTQTPPQPFHQLTAQLNNGSLLSFEQLKGKKVLLVNTASDCGYTGQYAELQKLYEQHGNRLVVIGFPANDFKEQERGSDEEIAQFCQVNYGVTFPLARKSTVVQSGGQNPVFQWLTDAGKNGWNNQQPEWNFSKYLVNENGALTHYFHPGTSPLSPEVVQAVLNNE